MIDPSTNDLGSVWAHAATVLPSGWRLDALRCASTGLEVSERSDDWTAVAIGPDGREASATASTPIEAIDDLRQAIAT